MDENIRKEYVKKGIIQYFMNAGAGEPGVHTVADNDNPYEAAVGFGH